MEWAEGGEGGEVVSVNGKVGKVGKVGRDEEVVVESHKRPERALGWRKNWESMADPFASARLN